MKGSSSLIHRIIRLILAFCGDLAGNSFWFRIKLKQKLQNKTYDFVFIDHSQLGNLAPFIRISSPNSKIIGAFQNIESDFILQSMKLPFFLKSILRKAALHNEQLLVKSANHLLCLSNEDSDQLQKIYGKKAELIIPITTDSIEMKIGSENLFPSQLNLPSSFLLFCGSYFQPNIDGLKWFVENVLDQIKYPLVVIGYQMEKFKLLLNHPNLIIVGTVDDVYPYYRAAAAVINPVFKGAGMNSKSVEAIGFEKALYSTQFALNGFPRPLPKNIYICNTAKEFIEKLTHIPSSSDSLPHLINYHKNNFSLIQRVHGLSRFIYR